MTPIHNLNSLPKDCVHFDTELSRAIQSENWPRVVSLIHGDRKLIEQLFPAEFSSLLHVLRQDECSPEGTAIYQDMLQAPQMQDLDRYTLQIQCLDQISGDPEQAKRLQMFLQSPFAKQFSVLQVQEKYKDFKQKSFGFLKLDDFLPSQEVEQLCKELKDALKELKLAEKQLQESKSSHKN